MNKLSLFALVVGVLALIGVLVLVFKPVSPAPRPGAVAGAESYFQTETHNGINYAFNRVSMNTASTTSCSFKTPTATSTLVSASAVVKGNQASETVNITTGTAMQASTTALSGNFALAAGAQITVVASTTNSEATRALNPNTWVQVNIFGGVGVASSTGICTAVFQSL